MELWQSLLVAFGGNAILLMLLGFLGRSFLQNSLNKDLERYKDQLQYDAREHEIRFSKLHEKRAEVIAEMYKLLVSAVSESRTFTSFTSVGEPDKKQEYATAIKSIVAFRNFFDQHKIYVSPDLCVELQGFVKKLLDPVLGFGTWLKIDDDTDQAALKKDEAWNKAYELIQNDIPPVREAIENEFRVLLGVVIPDSR